MGVIRWREDYSVGVERLDRDHQKLVAMIEVLYGHLRDGSGEQHVQETLEGLIAYANSHFKYEEQLMAQCAFPDLENHLAEHTRLREQVEAFQRKVIAGAGAVSPDTYAFLSGWLIDHIMGNDKHYTAHFHAHGIR